jgi:MFS family permease
MMIFSQLDPLKRAQLNAVMTVALFVGQVIGTSTITSVFLKDGWKVCYALAIVWTGLHVFILFARGPHLPTRRLIGWASGLTFPKPRQVAEDAQPSTGSPEPRAAYIEKY